MSRKAYDQELLKRILLGPMTAQDISAIMGGYGSASDHVANLRRRKGWTVRVVGELPREEGQRGRLLRLFRVTTPLKPVCGAYCCGYCEMNRMEKKLMTDSKREELLDPRQQMKETLERTPVIAKTYHFKCCGVSRHTFSITLNEQFKISTVVFCPLWGCSRQAFPETKEESIDHPINSG